LRLARGHHFHCWHGWHRCRGCRRHARRRRRGAYGQAFGYRDIDAAQNNALRQCKGAGCRVVATLRRSCAALAVDVTNPCSAHGSGQASQLGTAQNNALRQCYRGGGKDCVIRAFVCDGKDRG
jgi:hypothetical protein